MRPPRVALVLREPADTRALGYRLGAAARAGDLVLLEGDFGAGKTTLVQGLAAGLGVRQGVTSPSFVIETRYEGRVPLYHVDLYRLERLDDAFLSEIEEHLFGDGVTAIEWPALLPDALTTGALAIRLRVNPDDSRTADLAGGDERLRMAAEAPSGALDDA